MPQFSIKRDQLPPGEVLCQYCTGLCCRYFAVPIDTPTTWKDFDNIRWYVLHQSVSVLRDWEGNWMVQFDTPCAWLKDGRCSHYALRPGVCRDYDPAECERYCTVPAEKVLIRDEKDLDHYLEERKAQVAARRSASPSTGRRTKARPAKAAR